jgi:hypothetical protein
MPRPGLERIGEGDWFRAGWSYKGSESIITSRPVRQGACAASLDPPSALPALSTFAAGFWASCPRRR